MTPDQRERLRSIKDFEGLVAYLHDELDWPIGDADFEDLTYDYTPEELGIDESNAAKIQEIKRLRPLVASQPWGVFFVSFEPKRLPVVALRRILGSVAVKKRSTANASDRIAWSADDLLFISNFGEGSGRQISFAHFSVDASKNDLPTLRVLGWDDRDTPLHIDAVADALRRSLVWPTDPDDAQAWRSSWSGAFSLRHREVVTTSRALAERLAQLAKGIRERIRTVMTIETESGPTSTLLRAFRESLIHDLTEDDFADMYAQTISYGLLSARVAHPVNNTAHDLALAMPATTPFLKELMETFLTTGGRKASGIDFDELGVSEVVDLLDNANMEAVLRDFGDRNPQEDPVIHFYELFLREYDAEKRMQRGVFYTPRPVVSYIVRSVHEALRDRFGLEYGLADTSSWAEVAARTGIGIPTGVSPVEPFVKVLDPATGTGTFLVEVIDLIHTTMVARWENDGASPGDIDGLWNEYVPEHLLPRICGYELLMAPYAIAHLKVGLKLHETGYRFDSDARARVYLTNALEPSQDFADRLEFAIPALAHEARAVNEVKDHDRFTVVLGNPPYFGEAGRGGDWIASLMRGLDTRDASTTNNYFASDGLPLAERTTKWINDDYVKFIRLADRLLELTGTGVVGYVTNHSYLDNPTFRGVRQSLLRTFDRLTFVDLHGNANKKETTPDGGVDQNVFDILQGVAIAVMERNVSCDLNDDVVLHSELWGTRDAKYEALLSSEIESVEFLNPRTPQYLLVPQDEALRAEYDRGWSLVDIFSVHGVGITTARDHVVVDFDHEPLVRRAGVFRDSDSSDAEVCRELGIPEKKGWNVSRARQLIRAEQDLDALVKPILYRPLDTRLIFYHDSLVWRTVKVVMRHMLSGHNFGLVTTRQTKDNWGATVTRHVIGHKTCGAYDVNSLFPLYVEASGSDSLFAHAALGWDADENDLVPNLSDDFVRHLAKVTGLTVVHPISVDGGILPTELLGYVYALFHAPSYRARYADFLKSDFARIPLPADNALFRELSAIGSELIGLHLVEDSASDSITASYFGPPNPVVTKVAWADGTVWLDAKAGKGATQGSIGFKGVSSEVWTFKVGGYQVAEKWLKDRISKPGTPARPLSDADLRHYAGILHAFERTIVLMDEADAAIARHGDWPVAFATDCEQPDDGTQAAREDGLLAAEATVKEPPDQLWSEGVQLRGGF